MSLVQVPCISGWAKLGADGTGVARRLNMFAFNVEGHGVFVSGSMAAVSAPKPRVSWVKVRKGENSSLYFFPESA